MSAPHEKDYMKPENNRRGKGILPHGCHYSKKYMKKIIIIVLCAAMPGLTAGNDNKNRDKHSEKSQADAASLSGDDRADEMITLSGSHDHSGGYGAIFLKGTSFRDQTLLIAGLRGAWVVNRSFGIGIDLNGIIPTSEFTEIDPVGFDQAVLVGGYGGLLLEPVVWSNKIVHLTFPISIGAGWLGYIEDWENDDYYYNGDIFDDDVFWYFEPGVNVEINVARFFRVGVGVSRRFVQDLQLLQTSSKAFDEMNYGFTLKFGSF